VGFERRIGDMDLIPVFIILLACMLNLMVGCQCDR
jgi:hypothetical protein